MSVVITTVGWVGVTFLTKPVDNRTLVDFYKLIKPHSYGWKPVVEQGIKEGAITTADVTVGKLPTELTAMFASIFMVYSLLFTTGYYLYGNWKMTGIGIVLSAICAFILRKAWQRIQVMEN